MSNFEKKLMVQKLKIIEPLLDKQQAMFKAVKDSGINIVTCPHCGAVIMHKIPRTAKYLRCHSCLTRAEACHFPDLYYYSNLISMDKAPVHAEA